MGSEMCIRDSYMVVNGNGVTSAIEGVITKALSNTPG